MDETGVSLNLHPDKGWNQRGHKLINKNVVQGKNENYSLIVAISEKRLFGYQFIEGGVRGADFFSFITNLVKDNKIINQLCFTLKKNIKFLSF